MWVQMSLATCTSSWMHVYLLLTAHALWWPEIVAGTRARECGLDEARCLSPASFQLNFFTCMLQALYFGVTFPSVHCAESPDRLSQWIQGVRRPTSLPQYPEDQQHTDLHKSALNER